MDVRLTKHARKQLGERRISRAEVEDVLSRSDRREDDEWVHIAYRIIRGRESCVLTAKHVSDSHLVVTLDDTAQM